MRIDIIKIQYEYYSIYTSGEQVATYDGKKALFHVKNSMEFKELDISHIENLKDLALFALYNYCSEYDLILPADIEIILTDLQDRERSQRVL